MNVAELRHSARQLHGPDDERIPALVAAFERLWSRADTYPQVESLTQIMSLIPTEAWLAFLNKYSEVGNQNKVSAGDLESMRHTAISSYESSIRCAVAEAQANDGQVRT